MTMLHCWLMYFSKSSYFRHLVSVCFVFLSARSQDFQTCVLLTPWDLFHPSDFFLPPSFYLSPESFLASLCWEKKQSFNCNFHAGSLVKEWCSIPCAKAVRSICHWQDYLRRNICQTHTRTGAENTDNTVSGNDVLGSVPWEFGGE